MWRGFDLNNAVLLLVALMNGFTLYYSRRTEKNTNSMKDALVASTAKEQFAAGETQGRLTGEAKAAVLAQGLEAGRKTGPLLAQTNNIPVPVVDDKAAAIAERGVVANERIADAAEIASATKP